jgi:tripartite-type tricarboxylate transporter receptor subunit TctC
VKFRRREFLHLAAGALVTPAVSPIANAQAYPSRPIRIIASLPAGLAPDVVSRIVAEPLSQRIGVPIVVENKPGAAGNIGTEYVVRSDPDGYTLLAAISGNAINASLYPNLTFNFVRDTVPVALLGLTPYVMVVNPSVPAKNVPEFIAYAKVNPDKVNMASPGTGTAPHLSGELFKMMTGLEMVHVAYRSSFLPDLISGVVQVAFIAVAPVAGYIKSGDLRVLGVTSASRMDMLPDIPAISEFVSGYEGSGWLGICAPKATPPAVVERLNKEINSVTSDPAMKARLTELGVGQASMTPDQFGSLITDAVDKWAKVIKFASIKAE